MQSKISTVDLIKQSLQKKFGEQSVSYVSFDNSHLELDLKGFLTSPQGKAAIKKELDAAKRIPFA